MRVFAILFSGYETDERSSLGTDILRCRGQRKEYVCSRSCQKISTGSAIFFGNSKAAQSDNPEVVKFKSHSCNHVGADVNSFVPLFYKKTELTLNVAPPFHKKARSRRLFVCKRTHNAFGSLPPFCD